MKHRYRTPAPPGITPEAFEAAGLPKPDFLLAPTEEDARLQLSPTEHIEGNSTSKGAGVVLHLDKYGVPYMDLSGDSDAWVDTGNHPIGQGEVSQLTVMYCVEPYAGGVNRQAILSCWQANNTDRNKFYFGTVFNGDRDLIFRYPRESVVYNHIADPGTLTRPATKLGENRRVVSCSMFEVITTGQIHLEFLSHGAVEVYRVQDFTSDLGNPVWEDHKVLVGAIRAGDLVNSENFKGKIFWVAAWKEPLTAGDRSQGTKPDYLHIRKVMRQVDVIGKHKPKVWYITPNVDSAFGYQTRKPSQQVSQFGIRYDRDTNLLLECVTPGVTSAGPLTDLDLGHGFQEWVFDGSVAWRRKSGLTKETGFKDLVTLAPYLAEGDTIRYPEGSPLDGFEMRAPNFLIHNRLPMGKRIRYEWYTPGGDQGRSFHGPLVRFNPIGQRLYIPGLRPQGVKSSGTPTQEPVYFEDCSVVLEHGHLPEIQLRLMNSQVSAWDCVFTLNKYGDLTTNERGYSTSAGSLLYRYGPALGLGDLTLKGSRVQSKNYAFGSSRISYSLLGCAVKAEESMGIALTPNPVKIDLVGCMSNEIMNPAFLDNNHYGFMHMKSESLTDLGGHYSSGWVSATPTTDVYRVFGKSVGGSPMSLRIDGGDSGFRNTLMMKFSPTTLAVWNPVAGDKRVIIHAVTTGIGGAFPPKGEEETTIDYRHFNLTGSAFVTGNGQTGNDEYTSDINVTEEASEDWELGALTGETKYRWYISLTGVGVGWITLDICTSGNDTYICPALDLEDI